MTDNTKEDQPKLDLAQCIAAALARESESQPNPSTAVCRDTDIELGSVPTHLRHLHNLLVDSQDADETKALHSVFWTALKSHLAVAEVSLHKKKLLPDWTVLGVPDDGRSHDDMFGGDIVMIQVGGVLAEHGGGLLDALLGGRRGRRH